MCSVLVIMTASAHVCDLIDGAERGRDRDAAEGVGNELSTIPWIVLSLEFASARNRCLLRTEKTCSSVLSAQKKQVESKVFFPLGKNVLMKGPKRKFPTSPELFRR